MALYSAIFDNVTVSAAQDLFEIVAPSTGTVAIHAIFIGQSSDAGDAQAESLRILLTRGHTVSGSGGSSPSIQKFDASRDASSGATVEANNTTAANTSGVNILADTFNIAIGWQFLPTPEMRPRLAASQRFTVNLPAAPADALTMSGTIIWEELS